MALTKEQRLIIILRDALVKAHLHFDTHSREIDASALEDMRKAVALATHHLKNEDDRA